MPPGPTWGSRAKKKVVSTLSLPVLELEGHSWREALMLQRKISHTILHAWGWCARTTQRDGMGREEGGGFRMGNMPLRGEGSCGGGGAPQDSAGNGAMEEGLTSRGGRHLRLPLRFGLFEGDAATRRKVVGCH